MSSRAPTLTPVIPHPNMDDATGPRYRTGTVPGRKNPANICAHNFIVISLRYRTVRYNMHDETG